MFMEKRQHESLKSCKKKKSNMFNCDYCMDLNKYIPLFKNGYWYLKFLYYTFGCTGILNL